MGLLCDLFVGTQEEALNYQASHCDEDHAQHLARYTPEEFQGLSDLEFAELWAILAAEAWSEEKHMLIDIDEDDEGWLFEFPAEFVSLLAGLDDSALEEASVAWGETEELACSGEDIRPVLEALQGLARRASAESKRLYLWGSL